MIYLDDLNPAQRAAVETLDGPVLMLAGAGTGKTKALTARIAHVIATRRAWPSQILAVTFTNKAAREMRARVERLIGGGAEDLWLGTFHALTLRMLRRHAELAGLRPGFTVLDQDDQVRLVKQLIQAATIDEKRWPARIVAGVIDRWKDKGLTPEKLTADQAGEMAGGRMIELYRQYEERLKILNATDFGGILLGCVTVFTGHPDLLSQWQNRFRYIFVDEYQDTNVIQYLWLRLLAQAHKNICCVGDDDQSIYSFRGAEVGNILRFESDFPNATIIRLEQNYRSTPQILAAAGKLIAHNRERLGKTLWTQAPDGDKVAIRSVWDGEEEARLIADEIEAEQRRGTALDRMAILVRAGFQTREFEERLMRLGIAYRVIGGLRFYERAEIRDAVAYLRVIAQPDDDLAFERIVNTPRRGIGDAALAIVTRHARARSQSLTVAAGELIGTDELKPAQRRAFAGLLNDFDRWRQAATVEPPDRLAEIVLDESGYTAMWQADKTPEAPGRLENLKELVTALADFPGLGEFLEHVALSFDRDAATGPELPIMTMHGAKGLEFEVVFLPGWEDGVFPHQRALDESGEKGLEEERRLAYVGLTRARRRALICHAVNRRVHASWQSAPPSRFLKELDPAAIDAAAPLVQTQYPARAEPHLQPHRAPTPGLRESRIEGRADPLGRRASFAVGSRVFHQKFGAGTVTQADGDRLDVNFDAAGLKKVVASFVQAI